MSAPLARSAAIKAPACVAFALGAAALALLSQHAPAHAAASGSPALARDGSNAILPTARKNLDTGLVNVKDYGAVGDAQRSLCPVTSTSGSAAVTIGSPCSYTSADQGKPIVLYLENSGTATSPLATTIATVGGANSLTLGANAGQTLAPSFVGNTHATTTIDNIASTTGLKVGQTISGTDIAAGTYIAAVAANSITISTAATGTHSGLTFAAKTWVSWGTDNAAAINNAYAQAAQQSSATGQQGFVYFPPTVTSIGTTYRGYGVGSGINIAPGNFVIGTVGASRETSLVMALASMAAVVTGPTAFRTGNAIKQLTFDGNMVATTVGTFNYLPESSIEFVKFANPAPGGTILDVGNGGNVESLHGISVNLSVDTNLYTASAQYPARLLDIRQADTVWLGLQAVGQVSDTQIVIESGANNTMFYAPHFWGNTTAGTTGIKSLGLETWLADPMCDAGNAQITCIELGAAEQTIRGGRVNTPGASTTGILIDSAKDAISISGFVCRHFGTPANCIVPTYPLGNNIMVGSNPNSTFTPGFAQALNQNPAGTASTSGVMMGLGLAFTPKTSGFVYMLAKGAAANSTSGDGANVGIHYGTGTAPTNGAACAGSAAGTGQVVTAAANGQKIGINSGGFVSAMTLGTGYWVDLCVLAVTGGTATVTNIDLSAREVLAY